MEIQKPTNNHSIYKNFSKILNSTKSIKSVILIIFILCIFSFFIKESTSRGSKKNGKNRDPRLNDSGEYILNEDAYEEEKDTDYKENKIFSEDEMDFAEMWSKFMINFNPEFTFTINMAPLSKKIFYEDIDNPPTLIRGGYLVNEGDIKELYNEDEEKKISNKIMRFTILDPNGKIVVDKKKDKHLFNEYKLDIKGKYTIIFQNLCKKPFKNTFTMEIANNQPISAKHFDPHIDMLDKIRNRVKQLKSIFKFKQESNQERFKCKFSFIVILN